MPTGMGWGIRTDVRHTKDRHAFEVANVNLPPSEWQVILLVGSV
jgi:hypothetical protein